MLDPIMRAVAEVAKYLPPLPGAEALGIPACDGARTIAQAIDVFRADIDPGFKHWGLDVASASAATPAVRVQVHELVKDGTFAQMFNSLSGDLDKLVVTQHQVIEFCKKYESWMKNDCTTFFLLKVGSEFFVVYVGVHSGGLAVDVRRFDCGSMWYAERCYRLVFPQIGAQ